MAHPPDHTSVMLARHVLGLDDLERQTTDAGAVPGDYGQAELRVELRGMTHGVVRHLRLHQAALANQVEEKVRAACTTENLALEVDTAIRAAVDRQMRELHRDIETRVRAAVERRIEAELDNVIGDTPRLLAREVARSMYEELAIRLKERIK